MSDTVISVENLSKRYIIGHQRDQRDGLRHRVEDAFRNPFRWFRRSLAAKARSATKEEFWALKDVSFQIKQGEAVGIIGRNGAGKSTLLKILSRITEPTTGRVKLKGRVASLLEVGTGFHQELTGRENIFLNGAILGMSRVEIKRKFDEIVAFSEVEKFLDTPVKRYSSGMYVRLAFAVAAHLEPEILIVDEVLAVGDAQFQKKCLGKMGQVAKGGRTVLFVSHNMPAVQALCSEAIYLKGGNLQSTGEVGPMVQQYLEESAVRKESTFTAPLKMGESLELMQFELTPPTIGNLEPISFTLKLRTTKPTVLSEVSLLIYSGQQIRVAIIDLRCLGLPVSLDAGQDWHATGEIKSVPLVEGNYSMGLYINASQFTENIFDLTSFTVNGLITDVGYAPYAIAYRGQVELNYQARLLSSPVNVREAVTSNA